MKKKKDSCKVFGIYKYWLPPILPGMLSKVISFLDAQTEAYRMQGIIWGKEGVGKGRWLLLCRSNLKCGIAGMASANRKTGKQLMAPH